VHTFFINKYYLEITRNEHKTSLKSFFSPSSFIIVYQVKPFNLEMSTSHWNREYGEESVKMKKRRRTHNVTAQSHSLSDGSLSDQTNKEPSQEEGVSLSYLVLSKSWQAAALRAASHPHEAQFGCTSLTRLPVPLDSHIIKQGHNSNNNQNTTMISSPLAMACRYGAPPDTIQAILNANPYMVRRCIPNRGTPIHEAIMNFHGTHHTSSTHPSRENQINQNSSHAKILFDMQSYEQVISMLIRADEQIYEKELRTFHSTRTNISQRATMMQDVDGNNPLHLLVRHAFYNYVGNISTQGANGNLMAIFQQLITSSPEASSAPDLSEYEETPLILVLKSSLYAQEQFQNRRRYDNTSDNDDIFNFNAQLEQGIFQACKLMLKENPSAASVVASKSGYTPVHSAVYHGRCCDTIRLLLQADCKHLNSVLAEKKQMKTTEHACKDQSRKNIAATMRTNRFGETPLHFAAMRGECTKTIKLLSQAAPWAALKRDEKYGLTPLHWLLVRFVVRMSEQFNLDEVELDADREVVESRGGKEVKVEFGEDQISSNQSVSSALHDPVSSSIPDNDEQIQFDLEYHRRTCAIDPPCEYRRMRHILPEQEHVKFESFLVQRVIKVLTRVRETHFSLMQRMKQISGYHKNGEEVIQKDMVVHQIKKCPFSGNHSWVKPQSTNQTINSESIEKVLPKNQLKNVCPFTNKNQNSRTELYTADSLTSPNFANRSICPFAHSLPGKPSHCKAQIMREDDAKKCPFRCPFVFESYPIDASMMGVKGKSFREEKVISLFWAKVNSLLHAASVASMVDFDVDSSCFPLLPNDTNINMLHTACSSPTPLAVIRLCVELYPDQLMLQDCNGKYPLHHAASRIWDHREFPMMSTVEEVGMNEGSCPNLIANESRQALDLILHSSSLEASTCRDSEERIAFHHAIDSVVTAMMHFKKISSLSVDADDKTVFSAYSVLRNMIQIYPEAIEQIDGKTGLYPFMQASAKASDVLSSLSSFVEGSPHSFKTSNTLSLSLCYELLLASPSLVLCGV
jgi:hypothetical protein